MTWQGPYTRFDKLYQDQPFNESRGIQKVAGRYVLECDSKAADVYAKPPFSFVAPKISGDDLIFEFSREHFLKMFADSLSINSGKRIPGLTFFETADIRGGHLADPENTVHRQLIRNYQIPTFRQFKTNILKSFCESNLEAE